MKKILDESGDGDEENSKKKKKTTKKSTKKGKKMLGIYRFFFCFFNFS